MHTGALERWRTATIEQISRLVVPKKRSMEKNEREETNQTVHFNFKRCGPMPVPFIIIITIITIIILNVSGGASVQWIHYDTY